MSGRLAHIVRHPIKSLGWEELSSVSLSAGGWMPLDRLWGLAHREAKLDGSWGAKANFLRGVSGPQLMAIRAKSDGETLTLDHPSAGTITIAPADEGDQMRLLDWVRPLWPERHPVPDRLYRTGKAHLTDVPDPWISINSLASLRDVSARAGEDLSIHRWRGNLWLDGFEPWAERAWAGQTIKVGNVSLQVQEPINRCKATSANPVTGERDVDTLGILRSWGHQEFGVYALVTSGGEIAVGDEVELCP